MSSGFEASIAGTSTHMLDELSYALPASAQYMQKREDFVWTSGANVYAANGIRTMRLNISGPRFLELSSLVLECDVDNLSTDAALKPHRTWNRSVFSVPKEINFWNHLRRNRRSFKFVWSYLHHVVERIPKGEDCNEWGHGIRIGPQCGLQMITACSRNHPTYQLKKRILHKPLAGIFAPKVFLPLWAISYSGQGLSL